MVEGRRGRRRLLASRRQHLLRRAPVDEGPPQVPDAVHRAAPDRLPRAPPEPLLLQRAVRALLLQPPGARVDPPRVVEHSLRLVPHPLEDQGRVVVLEVLRRAPVEHRDPGLVDAGDNVGEGPRVARRLVRAHHALDAEDEPVDRREVVAPRAELVDDPSVLEHVLERRGLEARVLVRDQDLRRRPRPPQDRAHPLVGLHGRVDDLRPRVP